MLAQTATRFDNTWGFVYVEYANITRKDSSLVAVTKTRSVPVPVAATTVLLLGPGTSITQPALAVVAQSGCTIVWCGQDVCKFYAYGGGKSRSAVNTETHAAVWANKKSRIAVAKRFVAKRFGVNPARGIKEVLGYEGLAMRDVYQKAALKYGVNWGGRIVHGDWEALDAPNRALSVANACLYGVIQSAVVAVGLIPGLGFIHSGDHRSFIFDVADVYKPSLTIPLAFEIASSYGKADKELDRLVRAKCQEVFWRSKLLERVVPDMQQILGMSIGTATATKLMVHHGGDL